MEPTPLQREAINAGNSSLLIGFAGSGKSWTLQQRLRNHILSGDTSTSTLVLVAEPGHRQPFVNIAQQSPVPYTDLLITTFPGLLRETVTLFWSLVNHSSGFKVPSTAPTFLSYDLAQLMMWRILTPMLEKGAFAGLRLRPQHLVSQLLDILNRAAMNGLTREQAQLRQVSSWAGGKEDLVYLNDAYLVAADFRQYCLDNNLLDLSLMYQVFDTQLQDNEDFLSYINNRFRYLIADNVEEQTPVGQRFIRKMMANVSHSALAIDTGGGYKRFLAADPTGANQFSSDCQNVFRFEESFVSRPAMTHLSNLINRHLRLSDGPSQLAPDAIAGTIRRRYRWEMVKELATFLADLLQAEDILPHEVAIITPYLDGALRYSLSQALKKEEVPYFILRRRSTPRDEPRVRAWLTWLALAHPGWGVFPVAYDVTEALSLTISGLDPARAQLVSDNLYQPTEQGLLPVETLPQDIKERVGPQLVLLVEELRLWLVANGAKAYPVDIFLSRLFNDLLVKPRFQPKLDENGAAVCDWLVRTANRFRRAAQKMGFLTPAEQGIAFLDGIRKGMVATYPPEIGEPADLSGVMISTIHTYLLAGYPVRYQVWLETAATGWWDLPRQPLSNTFVMTQHWDNENKWTLTHDFEIRNELLGRIIQGLTNRCSQGIILATSDLDRRGIQQEGPLWRSLYPVREIRKLL